MTYQLKKCISSRQVDLNIDTKHYILQFSETWLSDDCFYVMSGDRGSLDTSNKYITDYQIYQRDWPTRTTQSQTEVALWQSESQTWVADWTWPFENVMYMKNGWYSRNELTIQHWCNHKNAWFFFSNFFAAFRRRLEILILWYRSGSLTWQLHDSHHDETSTITYEIKLCSFNDNRLQWLTIEAQCPYTKIQLKLIRLSSFSSTWTRKN